MPGKYFIDSNVIVYLYSTDEPEKQASAASLIGATEEAWVSTQVLSEVANVLRKKFQLEYTDIAAVIAEIHQACRVHLVSPETIAYALRLAARHGHSYYDSLILAAALECGADTVASEDMQDGRCIEDRLTIKNPFA
jgi:predicted nucleic acid-binding protein